MDKLLIFNGLLFIALGILSGIPYFKSIQLVRNNERQWRIVHLAAILAGTLLLAFVPVLGYFKSHIMLVQLTVWSMVVSNWLFVVGMVVSGLTGKRGLDKHAQGSGKKIYLTYQLATAASLLNVVGILGMALLLVL